MSAGEKVHFVGVAGFGVSALAQFHVMGGGAASEVDIVGRLAMSLTVQKTKLEELRGKLYVKAKTEPAFRFRTHAVT